MQTRSRRYSRAKCLCGTNEGLLSNRESIAPAQFVQGSITGTSGGANLWYAPPTGTNSLALATAIVFDWMMTNRAAVTVSISVTSGITPTFTYKINAGTNTVGTSFTINEGDRLRFAVSSAIGSAGTITFTGFPQSFSLPYSI